MRRGLFRRALGRGRARRSASRAAASVYRNPSGQQYRVVAVDEDEPAEFADPPRKWKRVGAMAAGWIVVLAFGAWMAPGFAASGSEPEDSRDQESGSANNAAWRYLRLAMKGDLDGAGKEICEGASPEVSVVDLDAISKGYIEKFGGLTDVEVLTKILYETGDGILLSAAATYDLAGSSPHEFFLVTVQESGDGEYCVSNAVKDLSKYSEVEESPGTTVDPERLASGFLTEVFANLDARTAAELQCESFNGISAEELDAAFEVWADSDPERSGLVSTDPATGAESSDTFTSEVSAFGDNRNSVFTFTIGVQGDCIAKVEGGENLMEAVAD